jgi:MFS family permease
MLLIFLVGSGAASVGVGFVHSARMLACAMAALGLMCSVYHPAGLAILSRSCQQRGIALGIHGVGGSVGITIAPLLTGAVAAAFGWRWAYVALGVLGFAAAVVLAVSRIEEEHPSAAAAHPRDADETVSASSLVVSFVILCCAVVGISICFQGSSAFLNTHITQQIKDTTLDRALFLGNVYTSVIFAVGILGQVVGGFLADRMHREEAIMAVATAGCVPFLILIGVTTGLAAPCLAIPFGFFYFSTQPVYNCLISKYTRPRLRGAAFGLTAFLTFGVGSVGATIAGWAADRWGGVGCIFPIMAIGAALSALACGALVWLEVSRRRTQRRISNTQHGISHDEVTA